MLKFHEDLIFKNISYEHGQLVLKLLNLEGKIVRFHPTEYGMPDPKMYKPDLVIEVEGKIYIIEFQSTYVDIYDKKRFRLYSALVDHLRNTNNKDIEVHVLSTVEKERIKIYRINEKAAFPIFIHSLKSHDGDEFLNNINDKIENNYKLSDEELTTLSLVPFMNSEFDIETVIMNAVNTICRVENSDDEINRFIRGIELIIADKFVKTPIIKRNIANLLGGNMQIIEDYAEEYAKKHAKEHVGEYIKENNEGIIISMFNNGVSKEDIAKLTGLDLVFVNETLSK